METSRLQALIDAHSHQAGALLPILHAIQDELGWVPDTAIPLLAQGLNLSQAEVHGVISFYHHFRSTPPGRQVVQICRAESCQAVGGRDLEAHARTQLGVDWHGTTADGAITLEPVYCLGHCACSPAIRIGDDMHGRVSSESFDALMRELRGEA
jgi:formate dehydrogenase subunit gamma